MDIQDMILRILGTFKIKYDILDSEINIDENSEIVNVHIDLNTVLTQLIKEEFDSQFSGNNEYIISSGIINLVAHMRAYFAYRHKLPTRFFLYFTDSKLRNGCNSFVLDKGKYKNIKKNISNSIKLVKIISKYCNRVYFIDTDEIEPIVAVNHLINKFSGKKVEDICITKDMMWYQLLGIPKLSILRPKRDDTILINVENVYDVLLSNSKYERREVSVELLSVIFSVCGLKSRNIKGVKNMGLSKTIKSFDKFIDNGSIVNEYYPRIENLLNDVRLKDSDDIRDNFYKLDLSFNSLSLRMSDIMKLNDMIQDKFSKKDLKMLNSTYYTDFNSLMLEELMLDPSSKKIKW